MKTNKNQIGITLIALVVTVIVLLILAGVSITMLTGQNGILNRAKEAKEKTETANEDEQRKLAQAEASMSTEKTIYKGIILPQGFTATKINGEDSIDDGLVITDGYGNEFVWVEVPKTDEVYLTSGLNIINFTDEEYTKIENDLHTYTNEYRDGTNYKDVYYEDDTKGWFKEEEYNALKQKMLKSIYQNGGFWAGRYEAGIETNRIEPGEATAIPLSQKNLYPYNWVTRTQAKVLAEKVEVEGYTSSIMFGVQWDLILKYFETKNATTQEKLKTDSTTIGNYYNSEFVLNRGKFAQYGNLQQWYNFNGKDKLNLVKMGKKQAQDSYLNAILLTTGATEASRLKNIYDIAGNVWEWTLEKTLDNEYPCTPRGGYYYDKGSTYPANNRNGSSIHRSYDTVGFRVSLY